MVMLGFFTGGIILQHKSLITLFWILSNPHRLTVIDAYLVPLTKSICHNSVSPWPNWVHLAAVWDLGFEPHQLLSLWPYNSLPCLAKKHVQLQISVTITGVSFGAGGSFLVSPRWALPSLWTGTLERLSFGARLSLIIRFPVIVSHFGSSSRSGQSGDKSK